jgi:hypothetical protein
VQNSNNHITIFIPFIILHFGDGQILSEGEEVMVLRKLLLFLMAFGMLVTLMAACGGGGGGGGGDGSSNWDELVWDQDDWA